MAAGLVMVIAVAPASGGQGSSGFSLPPGSPFWGSVPSGAPSAEPLRLTLPDALRRALDHNLGVLLAEDAVDRADGTRRVALSALLPRVDGSVVETRRKTNLEAFGFPLGPQFPRLVGPFNVFDARVSFRQSLFDPAAASDLKAESLRVEAARSDRRSARDVIVLAAANSYLRAVAAGARADSARAQLDTARALHAQARELRAAGVVAGIDVVRSEVREGAAHYEATAARNEFEKSKLQLARLIGLPPRQSFAVVDEVPALPGLPASLDEVLARAYQERPDFLAAQARVSAAEADVRAARAERLPNAAVVGDYGVIGLTPARALGTFSVAGSVTVPLFDGGRASGRVRQAEANLAQRRAELEDLRAGISYGAQSAFLDLASAEEQLTAATRGRELATLQLTQARDRFAAGVTNTVEVVQAQEAVAMASDHFITAQYNLTVAKALVLSSPGSLERAVAQFLGSSSR